ncbi:hypothetical protein SI65_00167 [Aspergillus cristatus]|uniref:SWI/SNF family DNA-dependent ATPase Ris1 n=1 Tax=Aspergillus cristatus TaxID=573508 RepID=A0A1E3BNT5_ASPCR|nr:hypothetical protein SI65_00167 [Aspergillus cristatus]
MADPSNDASIEDIMEDLQLHEVILQSLDEQRPDAVDERQEILDTIKSLQSQLARRRGEPSPKPSPINNLATPAPPSSAMLSAAQLDGAYDVSPFDDSAPPPPRWGQDQSPSFTPAQRSHDLSIRKRPHTDEFSDGMRPPAKRIQSDAYLPPTSSQLDQSTQDDSDEYDGADDLRQLLGLDDEDTMLAFQDEQRKAEQWLKERKEQERRDEEYARMLHDGLFERPRERPQEQPREIPRPASAQSSPYTYYSGSSLPFPTSPAPTPAPAQAQAPTLPAIDLTRLFHPAHESSSASLRSVSDRQPRHLMSSFNSNKAPPTNAQLPSLKQESDDSDIQEITPSDFWARPRGSSFVRNEPPGMWTPSMGLSPMPPYKQMSQAYNSVYQPAPGPSAFEAGSGPGPMYGPNVLQNTMARLNAGRQLLDQAGRSVYGGFPGIPFKTEDAISRTLDYGFNNPTFDSLGFNDLYGDGADPKKTAEEIKQLLENIRPDMELSKQNREGTPEALKVTLLEHQKLGLAWMKSMEDSETRGGILADDMGLGKTIQALALMVSRQSSNPECKSNLVIAPVALMQQWKREIERLLRPGRHQLSVFVLHGEKRSTSFRDLKGYDVVLTTFGTLASEYKRKEHFEQLHKQSGSNEPLPTAVVNQLPCLGPKSKWHRVIIDEAQCIKNRNTKAALAACQLDSTHRWCMSGTPMMNNVEELHSLLRFLRIRPYSNLERFNREFTRPLKKGPESARNKAMRQLQVLLKAVLLRRTKYSKIDGKPILQLPPRVSEKVYGIFSEDERELYTSLETQTQVTFNKYLKAGTVGRNYSSILVLLLRLRQACCHPHLMSDFSVNVETNANTNEVDLVANAKAFPSEVVIRLKDNQELECPICIDAVDNPIIFFPCGHSTCAECFSRISDPSQAVRHGVDGSIEVKCPNCRGKVDTKKITDHVTFNKVHFPDVSDETEEVAPEKPVAEEDPDETDSDSESDDEDLSKFIVKDNGFGYSDKDKGKGKGRKTKKPKKTLAELKKEGMRNQKAKRKYLRRLEKNWVSSAKIDKTMEILQAIEDRQEGEKTIIFSQFTSLLDLLEVPIARRGWNYRRYDGSMRPPDRNAAVLDFTDQPDCKIMLVSLKAGNSGLNLVAASQVIVFDPFWNPYIEEQAIDRAHRIGQQREVQVHRILVEKTVEDRILELQDKKRELIEGALDENASKNVSRLGTRELGYLFGVNT